MKTRNYFAKSEVHRTASFSNAMAAHETSYLPDDKPCPLFLSPKERRTTKCEVKNVPWYDF